MTSVIQICNLALTEIGTANTIQALNEATTEARHCGLLYDQARDTVLEDHPWGFARKQDLLADLGDPPSGWLYQYAQPSDCLSIREIYQPIAGGDEIAYQKAADSALTQKTILTDQADAELIYTARVEDPNMFNSKFIGALAFFLGAKLAVPLTGNANLTAKLMTEYEKALTSASTADARQESGKVEFEPDWIKAR